MRFGNVKALNAARRPICPWCGRSVIEGNIDHVVPKSMWNDLFKTRSLSDGYIWKHNTVNDIRNLMVTHVTCNRNKQAAFLIPSWSLYGDFRFWEVSLLQAHAIYVYSYRDAIVEVLSSYYATWLRIDPDYVVVYSDKIQKFKEFCEEFEQRSKDNHWEIDSV